MLLEQDAAFQEIADTGKQHPFAEGLGNVGIGTGIIALCALVFQRFGGKEDDGDVAGGQLPLERLAKFQAVHDGHHDVRHHQVRQFARGFFQGLPAVAGAQNAVFAFQQCANEAAKVCVVVHHQDGGTVAFAHAAGGLLLVAVLAEIGLLVALRIGRCRFAFAHAGAFLHQRKAKGKGGALAQRAFHAHAALVQLRYGFYQRQAYAGTVTGLIGFVEFLEDIRQLFRRDALSVIGNG